MVKIGRPWPSFTLHFIHEIHDSSIVYFPGVITGEIGSCVSVELRDLRRCSLLAKASEALQKSQTKLECLSLLFGIPECMCIYSVR